MRYEAVPIIVNESMAADVESNGIDVNQMVAGSIQAVWTGATADGTIGLEVSNDIVPVGPTQANSSANVVNWSTYTGSTQTVAGDGNFLWNMNLMGFRWVRLVYTFSSGTGTLNATFVAKG